jgi:hypothetical protein
VNRSNILNFAQKNLHRKKGKHPWESRKTENIRGNVDGPWRWWTGSAWRRSSKIHWTHDDDTLLRFLYSFVDKLGFSEAINNIIKELVVPFIYQIIQNAIGTFTESMKTSFSIHILMEFNVTWITALNWNCHSIKGKEGELNKLVEMYKATIVTLQEIWLGENDEHRNFINDIINNIINWYEILQTR